jgi:hypothetical protein
LKHSTHYEDCFCIALEFIKGWHNISYNRIVSVVGLIVILHDRYRRDRD